MKKSLKKKNKSGSLDLSMDLELSKAWTGEFHLIKSLLRTLSTASETKTQVDKAILISSQVVNIQQRIIGNLFN